MNTLDYRQKPAPLGTSVNRPSGPAAIHTPSADQPVDTSSLEKPRNGLAGLKHWRHDMVAGFVVSLISMPFSLGIAVASGAPPITGITSAIIAGFVLPFLGGSYVTISGPAAGLAPVILAGMVTLGRGDLAEGYPLLLVAIFFAGIVQVLLYVFKLARFAAIFPASVIEGMLCAIGLLIIAKQVPILLGTKFVAHDFWPILHEIAERFPELDPKSFGLGVFSLVLIFSLGAFKTRWLKIIPPLVIVVFVGSIAGRIIVLDPKYLIAIPEHPFNSIIWPDFHGIFSDRSLWWACFTLVLTLTMIDGVESLATIAAVDKIDPFKRKSDPNRTLLAMGVSNIASSCIGGLTIIPGGVKSTANILGGGRTQWANFYNSCFLLVMLLYFRDIINLFPYPVLAAVLVFIGYKLCRASVWFHVFEIGAEQLLLFSFTALAIVTTDLLIGVIAGILLDVVLCAWFVASVEETLQRNGSFWGTVRTLFRNPIVDRELVGNEYHLTVDRPLVCFNSLALNRELSDIPPEATKVVLHIGNGVTLVDHTTCENLMNTVEEANRRGTVTIEISGWDRLWRRSFHRTALHTLDIEQAQMMEAD
jgi:MFS superfamily sulfate permease-like transporter